MRKYKCQPGDTILLQRYDGVRAIGTVVEVREGTALVEYSEPEHPEVKELIPIRIPAGFEFEMKL